MDIGDLAKEANKRMKEDHLEISDNRISDEITIRRIQSYQTQGIIPKPDYLGRKAVYGEEHLKALLNARKRQYQGSTDRQLRTSMTTISSPLNNSLGMENEGNDNDINNIVNKIRGKINKENDSIQKDVTIYKEYKLTKDIDISLKIPEIKRKLNKNEIDELKLKINEIINNLGE